MVGQKLRALKTGLTATVIIALSATAAAGADDNSTNQKERLPGDVIPSAYGLYFDPNPGRKSFSGAETIDIQVLKTTRKIVLNSTDITVTDAEYKSSGATKSQKLSIHDESKFQEVILESKELIEPGQYSIVLQFQGKLNDKLKGFFREKVTDSEGRNGWLCATQMEPTDARRMFPCFDEPAYKATFSISTSLNADESAVSNSPVLKEVVDNEKRRKVVTFEKTPKMSTYLVALVIGHIVPSEPIMAAGVPIRVWCAPGKEKMTAYSRQFAAKVLDYYTKYFNIPYCAKKLDLVAIPDFPNGAMENLGACTFREDLLLVDEKTISVEAKQQVALNVAHEMAHLWFGDLVTMQWWDDIWLNEAFAEWMSTKAVDLLEPSWQYRNQFTLEREQSMLSDSLRATQPIHAEIKDADQIDQVFDEITYEKGAAVLYMLEGFLGPDTFRDGIRNYLSAHELANATPENLWSALSSTSGKNVSELMHSWVYLKGFPEVIVDSSKPETTVSQKRFVFLNEDSDSSSAWQIPLQVRSLEENNINSAHKIVFSKTTGNLGTSKKAPYLVNARGEGYFRVVYSPKDLKEMMAHLSKMTVLERASLLSDQFYLALAGQIPVKQYLDLTAFYKDEADPNVTSVMCDQFNEMDLMIDANARLPFAAFVRDRLAHAKKLFGWTATEDRSDLVKRERAEVLLTLGTIGQDKETIDQARKLANEYFTHEDATAVESELYEPMLKIVAYNGNRQDFAKIQALWRRCKTPERKQSTLMALAMFQEPALIEKTLKMCLSSAIEKQDAPLVMAAIMEGRAGRGLAWEFFRKHIILIAWRFPEHLMLNLVMAMNALGEQQQLDEVKAFFKKHPVPSQARGINKIIEAIEIRVAFRRHNDLAKTFSSLNLVETKH
ncbi:MAG: M1 family metallopeptidase [Candidatus Obscuribacterales bacterium]|nr:M1 family metallopeptidase [Candidatus Obscuribacterales bacterium]